MNSCQNCPVLENSIFCSHNFDEFVMNDKFKKQFSFKKGQSIFSKEINAGGVYCIKSGVIKIVKADSNGNETIVRIANPGDIVRKEIRNETESFKKNAIALTRSEVCFISQPIFDQLIKDYKISQNFLKKTFDALDRAEGHICSYHTKNVIGRLAEFLIDAKNKEGAFVNDRWEIELKLNREDIASLVGTASETVIRSISELKRMGVISGQKKIYIEDEKRLQQIAGK